MSRVFHREPRNRYSCAVRGEGVYLYDEDGRQYLDASGGAAVSCIGHGHPVVVDAIRRQLDRLAYAHTSFFTNEPQERLADRLVDRFGDPGARVYFLSGGSEANETALKLVRQYWLARGRPEKSVIVSREQSYHGNTLGALSMSGNRRRRELFAPLLHDWPRVAPCYAYRLQRQDETEEEYGARAAQALEDAIAAHGAERIGAFIAETVAGATLGAVPPVPGYFRRIREICDRHEILLLLDEVMAGAGRSGTYFAFEQDGVMPDIVTVAKGLGGGYQAIGATIAKGFIHDAIVDAYNAFEHGHTYIGHATACAAANAVMDVLERDDLLENVGRVGQLLRSELAATFAHHPRVGDIRGRGLLIGIELVADRGSKTPLAPGCVAPLKKAALDHGLIVYPSGGTADGTEGAHILLAPPFLFEARHVDELVGKLDTVLNEVDLEP